MIFAQKQKIQSTNLLALCLTKCNLTYNDFSTKSMDRLASPILVINADKSIMTIKSKFSTQGLMINFFIKLCFITIVILLLSWHYQELYFWWRFSRNSIVWCIIHGYVIRKRHSWIKMWSTTKKHSRNSTVWYRTRKLTF